MPAGDAGREQQPVDTAAIRQRLAEVSQRMQEHGHAVYVDGPVPLAEAVVDVAKTVPLLLDEVDRLRAQLAVQQAVVDAARAAVSEYFDILEAQQREVLGEDAQEIIEEMEQGTTGTRRLAEARRRVYALLGRTVQAAQPEVDRA